VDAVSSPFPAGFDHGKTPNYVGDDVALTQTTGWVDAWTSRP
jgi:hypothetical protein